MKCKQAIRQWRTFIPLLGAILLCLAVLAGWAVLAAEEPTLGDVDGDGNVAVTDARLILQYSVGKLPFDPDFATQADVNQDGDVTATDARLTLQVAVGKLDDFPTTASTWETSSTSSTGGTQSTSPTTTSQATTTTTNSPGTTTTKATTTTTTTTTTKATTTTTTTTKATTTTTTTPTTTTTTFPTRENIIPFSQSELRYIGKAYAPEVATPMNQPALEQVLVGNFLLPVDLNPNLPYNVDCYVSKSKKEISAMLPSGIDLRSLKAVFTHQAVKVTLNSPDGPVVSSGDTFDFSSIFTLYFHPASGNPIPIKINVETINTGLPSFCLTTNDVSTIKDKVNYVPSTFYIGGGNPATCPYGGYEAQIFTGGAKGRGNTSWGHPKKSFTLKLDKKVSLLDMPSSKNWVLVANYEDKSLLRNHLAAYLAEQIGLQYVMKSRLVDVFYNGSYCGTYTLMEKIEIEQNRLNMPEYDPERVVVPGECGYIMEFDGHVWEIPDKSILQRPLGTNLPVYYNPNTDELFFQLTIGGKWLTIKDPDYTDLKNDKAHIEYIYNKVYAAMDALKNHDYAKIQQLIDVESFVKWYIIEEYMNNTDSSMHSSVYVTLDVGGKLKLGPVWDFDRSAGNTNYWNTKNAIDSLYNAHWFGELFKIPEARKILREEWRKFRNYLFMLEDTIQGMAGIIYESQKLNFIKWDILDKPVGKNPNYTEKTYDQHLAFLVNYLKNRFRQMDSRLSNLN